MGNLVLVALKIPMSRPQTKWLSTQTPGKIFIDSKVHKVIMISFLNPVLKIYLSFPRISLVAPGGRHTLMLTESGEVYTCGSNDFGQLGREGSQTRFNKHLLHN